MLERIHGRVLLFSLGNPFTCLVLNTQGSKATSTLVIERAVGNYVLNLELIKLSVKSEVGGDSKILVLNLKRLFVGNIFNNHKLIFGFNFSHLRSSRFRYEKAAVIS